MDENTHRYLSAIGRKGGKKSRRSITPEQQRVMQIQRRKKYVMEDALNIPEPTVELCRNAPKL